MKAVWLATLIWGLVNALPASASVTYVPSSCAVYFGGEPDLQPEDAARLPEGGMLRICRLQSKPDTPIYTIAPKPILTDQGVCRFTYREGGGGNTLATLPRQSACPRPDDASYTLLIGGASDTDYRDARMLFEALSGPGVQASDVVRNGIATFEELEIKKPRLHSVTASSPSSLEIEVRTEGADFSGYLLTFGIADGQYHLLTFSTWIA